MIFFKRVKRHQRSRTVIVIRALPHYMYCIRSLHFASSSTNAIHLFAKHHDILNINLGQTYIQCFHRSMITPIIIEKHAVRFTMTHETLQRRFKTIKIENNHIKDILKYIYMHNNIHYSRNYREKNFYFFIFFNTE